MSLKKEQNRRLMRLAMITESCGIALTLGRRMRTDAGALGMSRNDKLLRKKLDELANQLVEINGIVSESLNEAIDRR